MKIRISTPKKLVSDPMKRIDWRPTGKKGNLKIVPRRYYV